MDKIAVTNKLNPCPFCTSTNLEPDSGARGFIFFCLDCGAEGPDLDNINLDEAAEIWNIRGVKLVERLVDEN